MPELKVLVVDDEPPARRGLAKLLATHSEVQVVGESRNGAEAVRAIKSLSPDLVLLDVQMPGLDGFGVLKALEPGPMPLVVFITAFDEHAVRAFDVHAVDYLVKPFTDRRFHEMIGRVRQQLHHSAAAAAARKLAELLSEAPPASPPPPPRDDETLVASTGRRSVVIRLSEIDWIEAHDYCALVHTGKTSHLLRESIRALTERLAPRQFVRVHRSALVNLQRVRELRRPADGEWQLLLQDGTSLSVSRRQRPAVSKFMASRS